MSHLPAALALCRSLLETGTLTSRPDRVVEIYTSTRLHWSLRSIDLEHGQLSRNLLICWVMKPSKINAFLTNSRLVLPVLELFIHWVIVYIFRGVASFAQYYVWTYFDAIACTHLLSIFFNCWMIIQHCIYTMVDNIWVIFFWVLLYVILVWSWPLENIYISVGWNFRISMASAWRICVFGHHRYWQKGSQSGCPNVSSE